MQKPKTTRNAVDARSFFNSRRCSSEVATAIRGALIMAKMHLVPIRRGYWGKNSGLPHTIPMKLSGTCGSVSVRLIPAPRGTGLVAAPASKKILAYVRGVKILNIEYPKAPDRRRAQDFEQLGPGIIIGRCVSPYNVGHHLCSHAPPPRRVAARVLHERRMQVFSAKTDSLNLMQLRIAYL